MAFNNKQNENNETQSSSGIGETIANFAPLVLLGLEQFTGKSIPQLKGTLADILANQHRIEAKLDNLERNCAEQFQLQEKQLASLQQVSKLVKETQSIHFTKPKQNTED